MLLNCGAGEDFLRVPWTAMKSNQSILKEINPEYSLEAEAPTLWPPNVNSQLTGKDPDPGKNLRARRKGDDRG